MLEDEIDDSHLCIKCSTTIVGLENYIQHRKNGCSIKNDRDDTDVEVDVVHVDHPYGTFDFNEPPTYDHHHDDDHKSEDVEKPGKSLSESYDLPYDLGADVFFSSLQLQSSSKRATATTTTNTGGKRILTRKATAALLSHHEPEDEWIEQPTSSNNHTDNLMISGNKKPEPSVFKLITFNHDSPELEQESEEEEDDDDDDDYEETADVPADHTGGKWKPESNSGNLRHHHNHHTLLRNSPSTSWDDRHQEISEMHDDFDHDFNPPPEHTKGKWVPGTKIVKLDYKEDVEIEKIYSDQYWCNICNRKLASKILYERHLKSNLHLKRAEPEQELERAEVKIDSFSERLKKPSKYLNSSIYVTSSKSKTSKRKRKTSIKSKISLKKRKRRKYFVKCETCKTRLPQYLLGKHLISHYHYRRMIQNPSKCYDMILENIDRIVRQAPYQCQPCHFYTNTEHDFLRHWNTDNHRDITEGPGRFWCSFCKFECEDNNQMRRHLLSTEHEEVVLAINKSVPIIIGKKVIIECMKCKQTFRYNIELRKHAKHCTAEPIGTASNDYQSKFICNLCHTTCKSRLSLQKHETIKHKRKRYFCTICDMDFETANKSKKHRTSLQHKIQSASIKNKILPKKCTVCDEVLQDLLKLKQHMQLKHPDSKSSCPQCGKTFIFPQEVGRHIRDKLCVFDSELKPHETLNAAKLYSSEVSVSSRSLDSFTTSTAPVTATTLASRTCISPSTNFVPTSSSTSTSFPAATSTCFPPSAFSPSSTSNFSPSSVLASNSLLCLSSPSIKVSFPFASLVSLPSTSSSLPLMSFLSPTSSFTDSVPPSSSLSDIPSKEMVPSVKLTSTSSPTSSFHLTSCLSLTSPPSCSAHLPSISLSSSTDVVSPLPSRSVHLPSIPLSSSSDVVSSLPPYSIHLPSISRSSSSNVSSLLSSSVHLPSVCLSSSSDVVSSLPPYSIHLPSISRSSSSNVSSLPSCSIHLPSISLSSSNDVVSSLPPCSTHPSSVSLSSSDVISSLPSCSIHFPTISLSSSNDVVSSLPPCSTHPSSVSLSSSDVISPLPSCSIHFPTISLSSSSDVVSSAQLTSSTLTSSFLPTSRLPLTSSVTRSVHFPSLPTTFAKDCTSSTQLSSSSHTSFSRLTSCLPLTSSLKDSVHLPPSLSLRSSKGVTSSSRTVSSPSSSLVTFLPFSSSSTCSVHLSPIFSPSSNDEVSPSHLTSSTSSLICPSHFTPCPPLTSSSTRSVHFPPSSSFSSNDGVPSDQLTSTTLTSSFHLTSLASCSNHLRSSLSLSKYETSLDHLASSVTSCLPASSALNCSDHPLSSTKDISSSVQLVSPCRVSSVSSISQSSLSSSTSSVQLFSSSPPTSSTLLTPPVSLMSSLQPISLPLVSFTTSSNQLSSPRLNSTLAPAATLPLTSSVPLTSFPLEPTNPFFTNVPSTISSPLFLSILPTSPHENIVNDTTISSPIVVDEHIRKIKIESCMLDESKKNNSNSNEFNNVSEVTEIIKHNEEFSCLKCNYRTSTKAELLYHEIFHTKNYSKTQEISCPICDRSFRKHSLRCHLRQHTGEKNFICKYCQASFARKHNLKTHISNIHENKKSQEIKKQEKDKEKFQCDTCGKFFQRKFSLQQHISLHGERDKRFKCPKELCIFIGRSPSELKKHLSTHSTERSFKCDYDGCDYIGKTMALLKNHTKKHKPNDKELKCSQCDFTAKISGHMKRHMRIHTGEKPYKCPHCSYTSNNSENLRKHVLRTSMHPGKYVYECDICDKKGDTKFKTNLQREFRAHLVIAHQRSDDIL